MYGNFKEHAIQYVKQVVQEDDAGNYSKAFPLYMNALVYFRTHLKYEKTLQKRLLLVMARVCRNNTKSRRRLVVSTAKGRQLPSVKALSVILYY